MIKKIFKFTGYPFESITTPTLILYGTEDRFVPLGEQVYLFTIHVNFDPAVAALPPA
jgi:hypothetical protein